MCDSLERRIEEAVRAYMRSPANDMRNPAGFEPAFGEPLVGFAAGDDPIWEEYKHHVDHAYWSPADAFAQAFPALDIPAEQLGVVSWVLPQTAATMADQARCDALPSERWVRSRDTGENVVHAGLHAHVRAFLEREGIPAVSPALLPGWRRLHSERHVISSCWSERHAAFAAGLGTFGLCDGLITPAGKAMRTGAMVFARAVTPTPRPYSHHREYCLFFSGKGTCRACIRRCPVGAISEKGHDKALCSAYLTDTTAPYAHANWGANVTPCGLCQAGVPCATGIPGRKAAEKHGEKGNRA